MLCQHVEADYALRLLRDHRAHCGYLLKDRITAVEALTEAMARVARGETVIEPELLNLLLHHPTTRDLPAKLTPRELDVLGLIAQGLTDRGIAERLWLTTKTVETHVRHILAKLDLPADNQHNRRVLAVLTYLRAEATPSATH